MDLSAISIFPLRTTVAPNDKLVKPSEDFGVLTPQIGELEKIPFIQTIQGVNFLQDSMTSIDRAVEGLRAYLSFKLWPPYFDKICSADSEICQGVKDAYLVLAIDIKITKYNEEDRRFEFKILKTTKTSKLGGNYVKERPLMPFVKCPF